ncbi:large ribosomal subunit protein uL29m-like [Acropora muricata]|uniref:large ribosomal subunit protein uL29m-like n=1 Tax=Acropora muricata TaxID=159855 RepID=UPI0034E40540
MTFNMAVVLRGFQSSLNFRSLILARYTFRSDCLRCLQSSAVAFGFEEFFPPGVLEKGEFAPESVETGRRWRAGELRAKSNEDLHKLWYVLLKERNMLLTLRHEAKRQGVPMPSPTRLHKVQKSMAAIKAVIGERERILKALEQETWPFDHAEDTQETVAVDKADDIKINETDEQHTKAGFFNKLKLSFFSSIWRTS